MLGWRRERRGGLRERRWLVRWPVGTPCELCISVSRRSGGDTLSADVGLGSSNCGGGGGPALSYGSSPKGVPGIPMLDRSIIV